MESSSPSPSLSPPPPPPLPPPPPPLPPNHSYGLNTCTSGLIHHSPSTPSLQYIPGTGSASGPGSGSASASGSGPGTGPSRASTPIQGLTPTSISTSTTNLSFTEDLTRTLHTQIAKYATENAQLRQAVYDLSHLAANAIWQLKVITKTTNTMGKNQFQQTLNEVLEPFDLTRALKEQQTQKQAQAHTGTQRENSAEKQNDQTYNYASQKQMQKMQKYINEEEGVLSKAAAAAAAAAAGSGNTLYPNTLNASNNNQNNRINAANNPFQKRMELIGHNGAVYAVKFNHDGTYLATGSFDKTVRVWSLDTRKDVAILGEHTMQVADVCWSNDNALIASGAFDRTARLWDVVTTKCICSYEVQGFAQTIAFVDGKDAAASNLLAVGSTAKKIYLFDRRQAKSIAVLENDAMISSLYALSDGTIVSGDQAGNIKLWSVIEQRAIAQHANDSDSRLPISCVTCAGPPGQPESVMAVNSFDDILRLYKLPANRASLQREHSCISLMSEFVSHKNKNWPIKSSIFHGMYYREANQKKLVASSYSGSDSSSSLTTSAGSNSQECMHSFSQRRRGSSNAAASSTRQGMLHDDSNITSDLEDVGSMHEVFEHTADDVLCSESRSGMQVVSQLAFDDMLLVATGSTDNNAYIYNTRSTGDSLLQQIEGHRDRVYSVHWHPQQPVLATASADFTVKLWAPRSNL